MSDQILVVFSRNGATPLFFFSADHGSRHMPLHMRRERQKRSFDVFILLAVTLKPFILSSAFFSGVKTPLYIIGRAYGTGIDDWLSSILLISLVMIIFWFFSLSAFELFSFSQQLCILSP